MPQRPVSRAVECFTRGASGRAFSAHAHVGHGVNAGRRYDARQMDYTSRPLDVALQQDGWLAVQTADGSEGYTRNGSIQVDPTGQLTIQGIR